MSGLEYSVTALSVGPEGGSPDGTFVTKEVTDLLFNLASPVRLQQLYTMKKHAFRMTELARSTNATIQETSRHLARMMEAGLIEKDAGGFYSLTSLGRILLSVLPSIGVLPMHRDFFLMHDLNLLPTDFTGRIGALAGAEFDGKAGLVQRRYERMISEANERLWIMGDSVTVSGERIGQMLSNRGTSLRILYPNSGLGTPLGPREELQNITKTFHGQIEVRAKERMEVGLVLNEREARFIAPDLAGKLDYNVAFGGSDSVFHSLCRDLFNHHWNGSRRVAYVESSQR
jgi:predicted transcriptional regulator